MALPLAIVLAAVLRFTLPAADADTSRTAASCAPGTAPCRDLDSVWVWQQLRGRSSAELLWSARVRGREGEPLEVAVPTDSIATLWVVTSDTTGNHSCPSNFVAVNLVAGVTPASAPPVLEWFDVAGRRLPGKPSVPGVYFWRRGRERGVRVVLR